MAEIRVRVDRVAVAALTLLMDQDRPGSSKILHDAGDLALRETERIGQRPLGDAGVRSDIEQDQTMVGEEGPLPLPFRRDDLK